MPSDRYRFQDFEFIPNSSGYLGIPMTSRMDYFQRFGADGGRMANVSMIAWMLSGKRLLCGVLSRSWFMPDDGSHYNFDQEMASNSFSNGTPNLTYDT